MTTIQQQQSADQATVRVDTTYSNGMTVHGTGVLITPDEVLTAAHMTASTDLGKPTQITVTPDLNGSDHPLGTLSVADWHSFQISDPHGQISPSDAASDVALLHLSQPVNAPTMGIDTNFLGGAVNLIGYPGDPGLIQASGTTAVQADPSIAHLWNYPSAFGSGGDGGPLWINEQTTGENFAVGVVSTATHGADLNDDAVTQINNWIAADHPNDPTQQLLAMNPDHSLWMYA